MAGIVVVTYNSEEVIEDCLRSCFALPGHNPIVVIDNASTDGTVARARSMGALVEANARNRGFAAAVNQGVIILDEPAILILNPDAAPTAGIEEMERTVLSGRTGAVGGTLLGSDGLPQLGFQARSLPTAWTLVFEILGLNRLFPGNPVNRRYRHPDTTSGSVEQPAGAFLMICRSAWASVGGFDEQFYPVWFEDVDFCKRLLDAGWRIAFLSGATATHSGGHSVRRLGWGSRQLFWYGSLLRYALKHYDTVPRMLVSLAVAGACLPRMLAGLWITKSWEPLSVYIELTRQACRSFWFSSKSMQRTAETQTKT